MVTGMVAFFIILLLILFSYTPFFPLKQRTPQKQTQAKQKVAGVQSQDEQLATKETTPFGTTPKPRAQVKKSVFDEWKDMRARRVPVGTKVRWRLKVWIVHSDYYLARLEGKWDYDVRCPRGLLFGEREGRKRDSKWMLPVAGDWVEIQGRFDGLTSRGDVMLDPDDFTNLGPGY